MKKQLLLYSLLLFGLFGCIGDDVIEDRVPESVSITNPIDTLQIGGSYQFNASYFDNIGRETQRSIEWNSSDLSVLTVDNAGLASGISAGNAVVTAIVEGIEGRVESNLSIIVSESETNILEDVRTGLIRTTSSYVLDGSFELKKNGDDLILTLSEDFKTTDALPGLFVYLGNNPSSINGAYEIGPITQFSGRHSYTIPGVDLFQYQYVLFWCKPFGVKVGEGTFSE